MKKNFTAFAVVALLAAPALAFADHYRGGYVSFGGGSLIVGESGRNETFTVEKDVRWVNDAGTVVDYNTVKVGRPVTVHYAPSGTTRRVERIVVHD